MRNHLLQLRVSQDEKDLIARAAKAQGMSQSEWARRRLVSSATSVRSAHDMFSEVNTRLDLLIKQLKRERR
jgi:uncharacterized protein (DUF1778 family)